MKNIYYLFLVLSSLLIGCSTISNINQFNTREEFYGVVNKSIQDKDVNVILVNDSTINYGQRILVEDDSLFAIRKLEVIKHASLFISDIEKIDYMNDDKKTANILLKNGEKINCKHVKTNGDSIYFDLSNVVEKRKNIMSVNKIKEINCKTRSTQSMIGILAGVAIGLLPGLSRPKGDLSKLFSDPNGCITGQSTTCLLLIGGPILGGVFGGIIGANIGYEYIYQFNPE